MRNQLLTGVAIAALSLTVAGAMAQERNPAAGAAPGASSSSSSSERGAAANRGEERSAQGQKASEGAGREGATRNASERGQERSAQGRDNNETKSSPSSASSRDDKDQKSSSTSAQSHERDQKGAASSASSRDEKDQKSSPTSAQSNEREQKGSASTTSGSAQRSGADSKTEGARGTTATGSSERDRSSTQSTSSQNAPSQANPREGAVQNNNQNPSSSTATTRTGSDQNRSASSGAQGGNTNVQVRGELDVDQQSATRVHDRLIRESGARDTNVNINVDIGGRIPDQVRLRPVPADIVQISPRYRNYEYTIVHDEIVIVEPRTKKVVQIISGGGGHRSSHMVRLDTRQRDLVKRDVLKTRTGSVNRQDLNIELREGVEVPDRVTLQTFPEDVWRDAPELREVRYFIVQDEVVLVDPDTREVIEILR